jgi:eukaryotic-like serine/threonine-protein kinase
LRLGIALRRSKSLQEDNLSSFNESVSPEAPTLDAIDRIALQPKPIAGREFTDDRRSSNRELVADDAGSTQDSLSLMQTRLRVAALALGFGFLIFMIWLLIREAANELHDANRYLLAMHAFTTVSLVGIGGWLGRQSKASASCLQWCELMIFGLPAVMFTLGQYHETLFIAKNFDLIPVMPIAGWIVLILAYAIFVPNTWNRMLVITGIMGMLPILTCVFAAVMHADIRAKLSYDPGSAIEMLLVLIVTIMIAVSSVRMIAQLREQASEAKQLGRYRLKDKLGSGGMGDVYLAEHTLLKRPCAIKVIRPDKSGDPRAFARFEREVQAASQLSHWNSIYIYDYGRTAEGTFFYVMEYLTGLSLQQLVKKRGAMAPCRVIFLLKQVCEALTEAHNRQLIHRDVKPANIMVTELGGVYDVAKLLDFGLVKPLSETLNGDGELTQVGTVTGSPLYMSPEQAIGEGAIDERSDIYSLGAVAYFMLTGRPPFESASPLKVMMAHAQEMPLDLRVAKAEHRKEHATCSKEVISEALNETVMKCLAKRSEDRFQSAREFADALMLLPEAALWNERLAQRWWESNCGHYQASHG